MFLKQNSPSKCLKNLTTGAATKFLSYKLYTVHEKEAVITTFLTGTLFWKILLKIRVPSHLNFFSGCRFASLQWKCSITTVILDNFFKLFKAAFNDYNSSFASARKWLGDC